MRAHGHFELWFALTLGVVTAAPRAVGDSQVAGPRPNEIVGITAPCQMATLASVQPSRIARIETAEGRRDARAIGGTRLTVAAQIVEVVLMEAHAVELETESPYDFAECVGVFFTVCAKLREHFSQVVGELHISFVEREVVFK